MRVLVCGGRDFSDVGFIYRVLDEFHQITPIGVLIEGDSRGVDRIAGSWARNRGVENLKFPARWNDYGKAAGHIRDQQMLDEGAPDRVIVFSGGTGTRDMRHRSEKSGVPTTIIRS